MDKLISHPYSKIRDIQREIDGYRYELSLIDQGIKSSRSKKKIDAAILLLKESIKQIKMENKKNPAT